MNENSIRSSCDSGEAVKRQRGDDTGNTDRLSHLPDFIIHHILSFLDTKEAVQTSVLSRVWRCAWKHVPVLHFRSDSFQEFSSFQIYVENVLSLRHPFNVRKMTYVDVDEYPEAEEDEEEEERDITPYVEMIKYTLAHNIQHLVLIMSYMYAGTEECYGFSELFGTILDCNLESLMLCCVEIDRGFGSSDFRMLTTLDLENCELASDHDGDFDPFSGFPCLKDLVLSHCTHLDGNFRGRKRLFKISGPQLLRLKLENVRSSKMEIFAPRLKFFRLQYYLSHLKWCKLSFPSLNHAVIRIDGDNEFMENNEECVTQSFVSLFQALSNVDTLFLGSDTIEVLNDISDYLEQQPSPFTRLKSLMVKADSVPYTLASYFLKGSSSVQPSIKFL